MIVLNIDGKVFIYLRYLFSILKTFKSVLLRMTRACWSHVVGIIPLYDLATHDDIIRREHFPRYWPFVQGIHWSPVNSPHIGQWRGALVCASICTWMNGCVNNREAGDLRCHPAHDDVSVMKSGHSTSMHVTCIDLVNWYGIVHTSSH